MPFLIGSRQACPVTGYCKGGFAALSPLALSAGDELYRAYQTAEDDRDWTYLFCERPQTREDFQRYLRAQASSADRNTMVVVDQANGRAVGTCAFLRIDPANGVAELGTINWSPLMRRSALGSEAIFLMLRHLFDDLGYRRCEWKCDSLNLPSRQAAERLGFRYEGTFRQGGCRQRTHARHRLAVDHRRGMAGATRRLCRWLSPDNISDDGRQARRLQAFQLG